MRLGRCKRCHCLVVGGRPEFAVHMHRMHPQRVMQIMGVERLPALSEFLQALGYS